MKRILCTGFALAMSLSTAGFAGAQSTDDKMGSMDSMGSMKSMSGMSMKSKKVKIEAQNGSGESGTAMLKQTAGGLVVTLDLTGGSGDQPAHIHKGTCANLNPHPSYPLTTVSDGKSTTTLPGVKLAKILGGTYAINVHKSTTDLKDYVSCGDIKVASGMMKSSMMK